MTTTRRNEWFTGLIPLLLAFAATTPLFAADCENYEDYLHWVNLLPTVGDAVDVFVQGDYAYVCDSNEFSGGPDSFLRIFDISAPSLPLLVSNLPLAPGARDVNVSGDLAVVCGSIETPTSTSPVFSLLDVADPADPLVLSQPSNEDLDESANWAIAHQAVIRDTTLVFLCFDEGRDHVFLRTINISDPALPFMVDELSEQFDPEDIASMNVVGDIVHLVAHDKLFLFDVSDPGNIDRIGDNSVSGRPTDVCVANQIAYVGATERGVGGDCTLQIFEIIDPEHMELLGEFWTDLPALAHMRLTLIDDICYVGSQAGDIQMVDVSDPANPVEIDRLPQYPGTDILDLESFGDEIYLSCLSTGGAQTVSVVSPDPMEAIGSVDTPGEAQAVAVDPGRADYAYVADGSAGIQIVDITDPLAPFIEGSLPTPGFAYDLAVVGSLVYVADGSGGLRVIDVSVPAAPVEVGSAGTTGDAVDLAIESGYAFVAATDGGLETFDIGTTPTLPVFGGRVADIDAALSVAVVDTLCYVAAQGQGLVVCSVSDPDNPWIIDGVKRLALGSPVSVDAVGHFVYLADESGSNMHIIDTIDPYSPIVRSSISTPGTPRDAVAAGIMTFLASGNGMNLVDIQDVDQPLVVGNVSLPAAAQGVFIDEFFSYVAADTSGLQICPSQCGFNEKVSAAFSADTTQGFHPVAVQFTNDSVGYGLSYDWDFGDGSVHSSEEHPQHIYELAGDHTATLITMNAVNADTASLDFVIMAEEPTIVGIHDVPDDQGGWVYVDFYHSVYDTTSLSRSEMYTIQRQDAGQWVSIAYAGAYGEHYYTALAPTQGDGEENWLTDFRIIGHMDEGNWVSPVVSGFSLDNVEPAAPDNVVWLAPMHLGWDRSPAHDLAYYRIYGSTTSIFDDAAVCATTIATDIIVDPDDGDWFFVTAVDDADLESDPSEPLTATGVPDQAAILDLRNAYPNPFNPSTRIEYSLPAAGHAYLAIYDLAGRRVRVLVNGVAPAGRAAAIWKGIDQADKRVASGIYFSRLVFEDRVLTGRLVLLK